MNRKTHPAIAMAVAAVTGLGMTAYTVTAQDQHAPGQDRDRQQQHQSQQERQSPHERQSQQASAPTLPQGIERSDEADTEGVRGTLRDLTDAAFTQGGFNDVVERFVDQDRNRFGEWKNDQNFEEFDTAVERLRTAFEEKYGEEIDLDAETAFERLQVVQGEITDPEQVATNWPVEATQGQTQGQNPYDRARTAGGTMGGQESERDQEKAGDEDANIEEGRNVAVAAVSGPKDRSSLNVSLINEFPSTWKVDVPNDEDPQQVYDRLLKRVEKLASDTQSWPEDAAEAERLLGYEVLAALYGVEDESQRGDFQRSDQERQGELNRPQRDNPGQDGAQDGSGQMPR